MTTNGTSGTPTAPSVSGRDLDIARALCEAVRQVAAAEVMPRYRKVAHSRKADGSLLTEADVASQEALVRLLQDIEPVPVVGEEMTAEEQAVQWQAGQAGLWCVDPIDGTSNFVHGVPYFAVSVALMREGRSVLGAIYAPVADEMFWAVRGHGAFLDDEPLPIRTEVPSMKGAFANVDFKRLPEEPSEPPWWPSRRTCSHRSLGSATLEWCYLAAGRIDVYLHGGAEAVGLRRRESHPFRGWRPSVGDPGFGRGLLDGRSVREPLCGRRPRRRTLYSRLAGRGCTRHGT